MILRIAKPAIICLLYIALFLLLPDGSFSYQQDFSVLYYTTLALKNGIAVYDHPQQLLFLKDITPAGFQFHPFPYPPWFALVFYPFVFTPAAVAAKLWAAANFAMLAASGWLLSASFRPLMRHAAMAALIFFAPALGLILVGQYSAPILLGVTLLATALPSKKLPATVAGLLLLTLKPHLGLIGLLAILPWLNNQRTFAWQLAKWLGPALLVLGLASLLADERWPVTYVASLQQYSRLPGVTSCEHCASISALAGRIWLGDGWLYSAGVGLFVLLMAATWQFRRGFFQNPHMALAASYCIGLAFLPYIQRYDMILIAPAWFGLAGKKPIWWLLAPASYLILASPPAMQVVLAMLPVLVGAVYLLGYIDQLDKQA